MGFEKFRNLTAMKPNQVAVVPSSHVTPPHRTVSFVEELQ